MYPSGFVGAGANADGCFNPQAQDFNYGKPFGENELKKIENELKKDWCAGTSVLGGEPLEVENLEAVKQIAALTKRYDKTVALWTGFYFNDLNEAQLDALKDVDVVVDRSFCRELERLKSCLETARLISAFGRRRTAYGM